MWDSGGQHPVVDRVQLDVDLAEGIARAEVEDTATRAGSFNARAEVPLGDIERPPWLWPDGPGISQ